MAMLSGRTMQVARFRSTPVSVSDYSRGSSSSVRRKDNYLNIHAYNLCVRHDPHHPNWLQEVSPIGA